MNELKTTLNVKALRNASTVSELKLSQIGTIKLADKENLRITEELLLLQSRDDRHL